MYSFDPNEPHPGGPLPNSWREVVIGSAGSAITNADVVANTFVNGLLIDPRGSSYANVQVSANILGEASTCPSSVVAYAYNVMINGACGFHPLVLRHLPYTNTKAGDYALPAGSRVACFLADALAGLVRPRAICKTDPVSTRPN